MAKRIFFILVPFNFLLAALIVYRTNGTFHLYWLATLYAVVGFHDLRSHRNVLRNYPVIGHFRYFFESIRPEIQQYFVETNESGRPFSREQRSVVYQRAKHVTDTLAFGTQQTITDNGYYFALHSLAPVHVDGSEKRVVVGNEQCGQPYDASRLNISAMSFGALGHTAIEALNWGAQMGNFYQNTGEGGLTPYHLKHRGDVVLQIGTGNFSFRNSDGTFNDEKFKEKSGHQSVKMVEIKLSQGAKPSHGGLLPGAKVDKEIATIRGIEQGKDCFSPATNPSVQTPLDLMTFIEKVRELSGGKPVGFKLCLGHKKEWFAICKAMIETKVCPDFITVDGAEGGTGAAPLEFSNRLGLPIDDAISMIHNTLIGINLRDKIKIIASGKVISGFDMVCKFALGADICNSARGMMFTIGCIQSTHCNTNACPTGVATQDPLRTGAVVPEEKRHRVKNFHNNTLESFMELMGAMGVKKVDELTPQHVQLKVKPIGSKSLAEYYPQLKAGDLLKRKLPESYASAWSEAYSDAFN